MTNPVEATEALIQLRWPQYQVEDLDLDLKQGRETQAYVAVSRARMSEDLREGLRLGALSVRWVRRFRLNNDGRQPPPPANRRIKPQPRKPDKAKVDEEAIAERVAEKLDARQKKRDHERDTKDAKFRQEIRELVENSQGSAIDAEKLAALLKGTVKDAVPEGGVVAARGGVTTEDEDVPMYIPSQIVPTDVKASISVQESTSDASSTESAKDKLKRLRRRQQSEDNDE